MEEPAFELALRYALECIGKQGLALKFEQKQALRASFNRNDVFIWLPTGFGKSICFECLPFLFDHKLGRTGARSSRSTILVISPLLSLMSDQVTALRERGVCTAILSSSYNERIEKKLLATERDLVIPGKYSILFSAPEAIIGIHRWRELLLSFPLNERIVAVAIDEAHCVSKW